MLQTYDVELAGRQATFRSVSRMMDFVVDVAEELQSIQEGARATALDGATATGALCDAT